MKTIKKKIKRAPFLNVVLSQRYKLRKIITNGLPRRRPFGHFYSPTPSIDQIRQDEERIFGNIPRSIAGIDLNEVGQMHLFDEFKKYYKELPFKAHKTDNLRYFFENIYYLYSDAIFLYCMIRHMQPKKIMEIGSGHSSCVILDTNELFFDNTIQCTFIEPYPERLLSLIKPADTEKIELVEKRLQDIPLEKFGSLVEGDILFIDSTHVSKVGSDVNYIFFEILPYLNKGVFIHFHDIFYPFEYPKQWIYEGEAWNESYLLRTFLQYNQQFEIIFFNTFLEHFYGDRFEVEMPLCMKNKGGSIWIKKK